MIDLYSNNDEDRISPIEKKGNVPDYRSPFRRDYARIIHCPAFRRLQGKTQLFPEFESDFFRNRLTHSLEVAQISKSVAQCLNYNNDELNINEDLVEIAGLAHDLGHPPFGHNGERALNECMKKYGGFEGNAQTLRILTKIEKKEKLKEYEIDKNGNDFRLGLNLTYRSLASILKYDNEIPKETEDQKLSKGYYHFDKELVAKIKKKVTGIENFDRKFKTIECQIMDLADDIAYSTYDLEDAFKANFITPIDLLSMEDSIADKIAEKVSKKIDDEFQAKDVRSYLKSLYGGIFIRHIEEFEKDEEDEKYIDRLTAGYNASQKIAHDGYLRTQVSSFLIDLFINGIEFTQNKEIPSLSSVKFNNVTLILVEILKQFTYLTLINSSMVKISEYRGFDIVKDIFDILSDETKEGFKLLPKDFREMYEILKHDEAGRKRLICDFIAGMTDEYAIEFYGRLHSENPESIFKPF